MRAVAPCSSDALHLCIDRSLALVALACRQFLRLRLGGGNGLGLASDWWISGRGTKGGHWKRGGPGGEGPSLSFGGEGGYSTSRAMVRGRGHVARDREFLQVLFLLRRRKRVISCAWHASHRVALARAKPLRKTTSDATPGRLCPG
eukprot:scaffold2857_cov344-Pavlova_lutheri.AAC.1